MENNLNFDSDEYFGLGQTAFIVKLQNPSVAESLRLLFDVGGLNKLLLNIGNLKYPTPATSVGSTISLESLSKTTIANPIKIKNILYRVTSGNSIDQFGKQPFDFVTSNIDGQIFRGGDVQPNFLKRNWLFTNNEMVEIQGDLTIDSTTGLIIGLEPQTNIECTFILK